MLPRLSNVPQLNNVVSDYLSELQKQHFEGDIASNYADRLSLATDNSVYQQLPQAILFPKSVADVVRITKLANKGVVFVAGVHHVNVAYAAGRQTDRIEAAGERTLARAIVTEHRDELAAPDGKIYAL